MDNFLLVRFLIFWDFTVFENRRKSLIQHCEQSELRLHSYIPVKIRDFKSCDFLVKILELQKSKQMLQIPEKKINDFTLENTWGGKCKH